MVCPHCAQAEEKQPSSRSRTQGPQGGRTALPGVLTLRRQASRRSPPGFRRRPNLGQGAAGPHRPPGSSLRFRGQDRSPINIRFPLAPICHFSPGRVWVKQTAGLRTDESLTKVSVHCFHTYVILTSGDRNSGGDACPESRRGGEAQWRAGASSWAPAPTVAIWDPAVVTAAEGAVFEGRQELPGADRPEHLLLLPT